MIDYSENLYTTSKQINLLDPGLSTSLTIWVIPALYPIKAVKCGGWFESSFGKALTFPRLLEHLFLGRKPRDPDLGLSNLRCDITQKLKLLKI